MNVIKVWICFCIFNHMNHISFLKSFSCWLHHCMLWKTCVFCWKLQRYNSEISAAIKLIFFFFSGVAILQVHCVFCWTTSKLCNNTSNHWEKPKYITLTPQTGQELVHGSWVIRGRRLVEHRVTDGSDSHSDLTPGEEEVSISPQALSSSSCSTSKFLSNLWRCTYCSPGIPSGYR